MAISATVSPGKIFSDNESVTIAKLNALGTPTVDISGAVGALSISDNSITDAKIQAGAAIQFSKMEAVTSAKIIVGNSSNVPTAVTMSGDATISNTGAVTVSNSASATTATTVSDNAITLAKLEDGSQGDVLIYSASGAPARLSAGTSGQFLKTQGAAADPVWADVVAGTVNKYSTGWVQTVNSVSVADGATLTVPHALSTADITVQVWANDSGSDSGAQQVVNQEWAGSGSFFFGAYVQSPSSSEVVVQLSASGYIKGSSSGNTPTSTSWTGDYIKIVVIG